jgi:hypothetical protein
VVLAGAASQRGGQRPLPPPAEPEIALLQAKES